MSRAPKALDCIRPPDGAGPVRAFCALTYEFQPEFFETDLLPALFNLEAWDVKGWSSRIALERKLDEAYVGVVMDGRAYHGRPTLRIDLQPITRGRGEGKQHAKLYLLVFEHHIRLLVGSANLTTNGFRVNREVMSALDYSEADPSGGRAIRSFLQTWLDLLAEDMPERMGEEIRAALHRVKDAKPGRAYLAPAWTGQGESLPEQLVRQWPKGQPLRTVEIVSPFWSESNSSALDLLVTAIQPHVHGVLRLRLLCERLATSDPPAPCLPPAVATWAARRSDIQAEAVAVDWSVSPSEIDQGAGIDLSLIRRPLHAKAVVLKGDQAALAYIGSANCTARGWGSAGPRASNLEAGLILRSDNDPGAFDALLPPTQGKAVKLGNGMVEELKYQTGKAAVAPWPGFLKSAMLVTVETGKHLALRLQWAVNEAPAAWTFRVDPQKEDGRRIEGTGVAELDLTAEQLQQVLHTREIIVAWPQAPSGTPYPVNIDEEAKSTLPDAPGAGPLGEDVLLRYYQGRIRWIDLYPEPNSGDQAPTGTNASESLVDTTRIQAYQVREFVEALPGIIQELARTPAEPRALRRALFGPVSPVTLGRHIRDAAGGRARSQTASEFQLLELKLALARAFGLPSLSSSKARALHREAQDELSLYLSTVRQHHSAPGEGVAAYERRVDAEIARMLRGGAS